MGLMWRQVLEAMIKNYVRNNQSHPLNYVWTNTLSYNKSFGKHHIDAVFGSEFTRYVQEGFLCK